MLSTVLCRETAGLLERAKLISVYLNIRMDFLSIVTQQNAVPYLNKIINSTLINGKSAVNKLQLKKIKIA